MNPDALPVALFPGMNGDVRLFDAQVAAFPNLRVLPWVPPRRGESLCGYARRVAAGANLERPCVVGGASFGGIVALEAAARVGALGCVLIGSVRDSSGLPWPWRGLRPVAALGPDVLGTLAGTAAQLNLGGRRLARLARPQSAFARWAMCAVSRWTPSPAARRVRAFHVHGSADRVLPAALGRPDVTVPGGAHALPLFSPDAVNAFLTDVLRTLTAEVRECPTPAR